MGVKSKEATQPISTINMAPIQAGKTRWVEKDGGRQYQRHDGIQWRNVGPVIMAQIPPGDIATQPAQKLCFNAPFDDKHTYYMKIINSGGHRIAYWLKSTNHGRIKFKPSAGVLDSNESINISISCDAFDSATGVRQKEHITVEWTNTPEGAAKQFRREWFERGEFNRKQLAVEYNL